MGLIGAIGSAVLGVYSQNKSLEAQARANVQTAKNMITSMNFSFQNLEQERVDAFDATIADLQKIRLQGMRLQKQVEASVNEGLSGGGRTANLINRAVRADTNRAIVSSKDNYRRKSNEIDLNKEAQALNTKTQLNSMKQVEKPTLLSTLFKLGTAYYNAKQTEDSIQAIRNQAGVKDKNSWSHVADPLEISLGVNRNSASTYNRLYWDTTSSLYKTIYDDSPDYDSIFDVDTNWKNRTFKFSYTNPFTDKTQVTNFF